MSKERMCKLSIGSTTFILPAKEATQIFEMLTGREMYAFRTVGGAGMYVIHPSDGEYDGEVSLQSIGEFELISKRALGETYIKEKGNKS